MTFARSTAWCLLVSLAMGTALAAAQRTSVADAARQSRAKPKKARVITDDDLHKQAPESAAAEPSSPPLDQTPVATESTSDKPAAVEGGQAVVERDESVPCPVDLVQQLREQQASLNSSLQELRWSISREEDGDRRRKLEGVARVTAQQIELVRKQLGEAEKSVAVPVKGCPAPPTAKKSDSKAEADRIRQ